MTLSEADLVHLRRAVEPAREALDAGDGPFWSVLVDASGTVRFEDRSREVTAGDGTRHPEFEFARWAAANLTAAERSMARGYTSSTSRVGAFRERRRFALRRVEDRKPAS